MNIWTQGNFCTCILCTVVSFNPTTALHRYFKPADDAPPSFTGDLSSSVSLATINDKGAWSIARVSAKRKIITANISSGGETGFSWKFGPAKISHYPPHERMILKRQGAKTSWIIMCMVTVLNLKPLSITKLFPCHCKRANVFHVSQLELLLGSVKK